MRFVDALEREAPIFNPKRAKEYKADSNIFVQNYKTGQFEPANSINTLPSAYYFGKPYNDTMRIKQKCYVASGENAMIAEQMYNEMPYSNIIEYYIINLTLRI